MKQIAFFNSTLAEPHPDAGKRAKHYVFKDDDTDDCYWHVVRWLTDKDTEPRNHDGVFVSKRIYFGKKRVVEISHSFQSTTWITIAEAIYGLSHAETQE